MSRVRSSRQHVTPAWRRRSVFSHHGSSSILHSLFMLIRQHLLVPAVRPILLLGGDFSDRRGAPGAVGGISITYFRLTDVGALRRQRASLRIVQLDRNVSPLRTEVAPLCGEAAAFTLCSAGRLTDMTVCRNNSRLARTCSGPGVLLSAP